MPLMDPEFLELTRDLDLDAFWEENARCMVFSTEKPRCAASFSPDDHWLFEFLDVPSTLRYYQNKEYRDSLHREANKWTLEYVGRAFFDEDSWATSPKRIENLFGCEFAYHEGGTPWLMPVTEDPDEFARVLDQAEALASDPAALKAWALPEDYLREREQRLAEGRLVPALGTGSRGPATIMTSILKPETLFIWAYDHPDLLCRFRDILAEAMVQFNTILREFSGNTTPGWWITDDNSALFNKKIYRTLCYPVLERVLNAMAPGNARRYQHSDSSMGHLMEMQYALGIRAVNYGPDVDAALIRATMPDAYIYGQLPPFTLRNGTPDEIRQRIISDFNKAGATGGLEIATAGSTAAGTGLGRMRYMMKVTQDDTRYE